MDEYVHLVGRWVRVQRAARQWVLGVVADTNLGLGITLEDPWFWSKVEKKWIRCQVYSESAPIGPCKAALRFIPADKIRFVDVMEVGG